MNTKKLYILFCAFLSLIIFCPVTFAADVTLAWDPNPTPPDGYRLYYGTASGNYTESEDVGNVTQYTLTNLSENDTYYIVVRAYNDTGESGNSNEVSWTYDAPDTVAPSVNVSGPATTSSSVITLSGTASDNEGVTQVTWSNSRGGSGTAQGTSTWTAANIGLQEGANTITFTARDAAGNTGTASIQITLNLPDTSAPSVNVSGPSTTSSSVESSPANGRASPIRGKWRACWPPPSVLAPP